MNDEVQFDFFVLIACQPSWVIKSQSCKRKHPALEKNS